MRAVILQARLDSSRLPNKALLPLGSEPLISRVMQALFNISADAHVLACPEDSVLSFAPLAEKAGFILIAGPKEDVLGRYCAVIRQLKPDYVVRATGDNPYVFADAANAISAEAEILSADYAAYTGLPLGAGVEAVAAEALLRAERESRDLYDREHVCPYLYTHPHSFLLHRPLVPLSWRAPSYRLTVDTDSDYRTALRLFEAMERISDTSIRHSGSLIIEQYRTSGVADA